MDKVYTIKIQVDTTDALTALAELKARLEQVTQLQEKVSEGAK